MKKTDLEKNKGLKINSRMKSVGTPDRFSKGVVIDRREQRKLDQALGLIPFAVKLNVDLVRQIEALAQARQISLNELTSDLLKIALEDK